MSWKSSIRLAVVFVLSKTTSASLNALVEWTPMSMFFTADTHFSHAKIIQYCNRPFASVEEMDKELIARWNETVAPNATVYHLGDFGFFPHVEDADRLTRQLHGTIHLIVGNHDKKPTLDVKRWASVKDYLSFKINKRRIVMGHYPFRSWRGSNGGSINLHGHEHGTMTPFANQVDVGVDAWDFRPVAIEQIIARLTLTQPAEANLTELLCD